MRIEGIIFDFGRTLYDPATRTTFPEAKDTLGALRERDLKLGLVTVAETDDTESRMNELADLGLSDYFQAIDVVGRSTEGKDLTRVLNELGLSETPEKCAVVGDNLKREITAGNEIGAFTIWTRQNLSADWKPENEMQTPRATIDTIEELVPLIDSLNKE